MVIAVASPFLFAIEVSSQWVNGSVRLPLLQDIYLYFELPYHSNRPSGFAGPGVVGNILGVFVLINIALMPFFRSRTRGLLFMNIFFLSVGVVLTASKAAMGSLIMGLYLLVLLEPGLRRQAIKWSVAILAFLLLLLPAVVLLQQDVVMAKRISMAVSAGADYLKERLEWWGLGFQSLVNSYFVGDGIGGYVKLIDPYPHAHSYYFSVIFDLGLIGFVIYMYILARSLLGYVRSFPRARDREVRFASYCLFTAFVMTLVYGLVDEEYTYRLVFLFIGLGLSLKNIITHAPEAGSAREEGLPLPAFARRG
jgi:O-antigen ligase